MRRALLGLVFCAAILTAHAQTVAFPPAASPNLTGYATTAQVQSQVAAATAGLVTAARAAAAAPVQSVNTKTGTVAVPTLCRQQTATALAIPQTNPGAVSWTFPNPTCAFATPPSCWMDISSTTTGYVFDQPLNTARSTTAVTYSFTSHASSLNVTLGALSVTLAPPANSSVIMTCTAPPA